MNPIFTARSKISIDDYKKYLAIVTFRGKKMTLPFLILLPLILSIVISYFGKVFEIKAIIFLWVIFTILSFGVTFIKIVVTFMKIKLLDTKSLFDTYNTFYFYEDEVISENEDIKGENTVKYISFYQIIESKDYFILYFSDYLVQIIRKIDFDRNEELSDFLKLKLNKRYIKL